MALPLLLLALQRWRAEPVTAAPEKALSATPAAPRRVSAERLARATGTVNGGNAFRLDRAPAPVGFAQPAPPDMMGAPAHYVAPPPPRPQLAVSGIVGPPWQAAVEGVPGREGAVVVRMGDVLGDLRIREVTRTTVVVSAPDTMWRLTVRRPWQ